jgi:hypothetical protein
MNFKLNVSELKGHSVATVETVIHGAYKMPLGNLKLFDLLINENNETAMRHGIYLFFDSLGNCIYIGKCSSSHFVQRIGSHFGMSPKYGMNHFLKRAVTKLLKLNDDYQSYVTAIPLLSTYSLLLINANGEGKSYISKLEKALHSVFRPELNFPAGFPTTYQSVKRDLNFDFFVGKQ